MCRPRPVVPALNSYWKWIHVTTIAISSSILLVSGAASVLYLIRGRLERKLVGQPSGSAGAANEAQWVRP